MRVRATPCPIAQPWHLYVVRTTSADRTFPANRGLAAASLREQLSPPRVRDRSARLQPQPRLAARTPPHRGRQVRAMVISGRRPARSVLVCRIYSPRPVRNPRPFASRCSRVSVISAGPGLRIPLASSGASIRTARSCRIIGASRRATALGCRRGCGGARQPVGSRTPGSAHRRWDPPGCDSCSPQSPSAVAPLGEVVCPALMKCVTPLAFRWRNPNLRAHKQLTRIGPCGAISRTSRLVERESVR